MNIKLATVAFVLLTALIIALGLFGPWSPVPAENSASNKKATAAQSDPKTSSSANDDVVSNLTRTKESTGKLSAVTPSAGQDITAKLASFKSDREREAYINALVKSFAGLDPLEVMERIRQFPDANAREMGMLALYGELSGRSVADIIRSGEAGRFGVAGALGLYLMENGKMAPQQLAAHANEFLEGGARAGVLGRAAASLAATDAGAALALGEGLDGFQRSQFLARFAMGWAETQPEAARQWAAEIEDPRTRGMVLGRILASEASGNPALAAQNFSEMSPDTPPPMRARAAGQIAAEWAGKDTAAAMQWAAGLTNDMERQAAQRGIERVAPVGIGATLNNGSDGIPVIGSILPDTPASSSLTVGDRVLAVSSDGAGWVDARGVSPRELSAMIRGQPNTQVSLQVQSAGSATPRVVTLGRQQIMHRPQ